MIARLWHGWTRPDKADRFEELQREMVFRWIDRKNIPGYLGIQLYRRDRPAEVEFITLMWFEDWDAVRAFAGEDYEKAVVLPEDKALLARYDDRSQHYEVRVDQLGIRPAPAEGGFSSWLGPGRLPLSRRA